jgi:hypothetical protein
MKDLITKHNLKSLDLLYVDAEGYDGKIIIDFLNTTDITPIIILEFIHIKSIIFEILIKNLENKKYKFFTINENLVCYPENEVKYIKFNQ